MRSKQFVKRGGGKVNKRRNFFKINVIVVYPVKNSYSYIFPYTYSKESTKYQSTILHIDNRKGQSINCQKSRRSTRSKRIFKNFP